MRHIRGRRGQATSIATTQRLCPEEVNLCAPCLIPGIELNFSVGAKKKNDINDCFSVITFPPLAQKNITQNCYQQ